ncbi:hypothetical protein BU24DRAFT_232231 [Aaosphaeria arxii CBS 175.79]|uniref:Uncharacterized protein n=1 Tax=Aaosphaeria arxii CBS 175.79 TaxID=1450172 RepID=A0A6A5XJU7_9PLEO|nr:uncharacterized protein BU24DRAFT_232231 [Aaosphaeria arxii CBS 175.79]KAF2013223.1 hypothetical protein BU24DRAFT_232231 [Aaosphaeria arxii CBS 175.79]
MPRASPAPKPSKNASPSEPAVSFSNPASLLWAKQIKREHAFLLERMKTAEAQVQASNSRAKAAEAAAQAVKDFARNFQQVTERISALEEARTGVDKAIAQFKDIEKELSHVHKLQDIVVSLQSRLDDFEIGYRQSSNKSKTILDKMEVLRTAFTRESQQRDDKIVKKNDPADVRVLSGRLDAIEGLQRKEATERKAVNDRLEDIQRTLMMQLGRVELPEDPLHTPTQQVDDALGDHSIGVALRGTQTPAAQVQVPASPWSSSSIIR